MRYGRARRREGEVVREEQVVRWKGRDFMERVKGKKDKDGSRRVRRKEGHLVRVRGESVKAFRKE